MSVIYVYYLILGKEYLVIEKWYSFFLFVFSMDGKYFIFSFERDFNFIYSQIEWNYVYNCMGGVYMVMFVNDILLFLLFLDEMVSIE